MSFRFNKLSQQQEQQQQQSSSTAPQPLNPFTNIQPHHIHHHGIVHPQPHHGIIHPQPLPRPYHGILPGGCVIRQPIDQTPPKCPPFGIRRPICDHFFPTPIKQPVILQPQQPVILQPPVQQEQPKDETKPVTIQVINGVEHSVEYLPDGSLILRPIAVNQSPSPQPTTTPPTEPTTDTTTTAPTEPTEPTTTAPQTPSDSDSDSFECAMTDLSEMLQDTVTNLVKPLHQFVDGFAKSLHRHHRRHCRHRHRRHHHHLHHHHQFPPQPVDVDITPSQAPIETAQPVEPTPTKDVIAPIDSAPIVDEPQNDQNTPSPTLTPAQTPTIDPNPWTFEYPIQACRVRRVCAEAMAVTIDEPITTTSTTTSTTSTTSLPIETPTTPKNTSPKLSQSPPMSKPRWWCGTMAPKVISIDQEPQLQSQSQEPTIEPFTIEADATRTEEPSSAEPIIPTISSQLEPSSPTQVTLVDEQCTIPEPTLCVEPYCVMVNPECEAPVEQQLVDVIQTIDQLEQQQQQQVEPTPTPVVVEQEQPQQAPQQHEPQPSSNQLLLNKLFKQTESLYTKRMDVLQKLKSLRQQQSSSSSQSLTTRIVTLQSSLDQIDALIEQTHQYVQQLLDDSDDDNQSFEDEDGFNIIG